MAQRLKAPLFTALLALAGCADPAPTTSPATALCQAPESLPTDPLTRLGALEITDQGRGGEGVAPVVLDLAVDFDAGIVYAAGNGGLLVYEIEDPEGPTRVAREDDFGSLQRIAAAGDGLFVGVHLDHGVSVYDASDPTRPALRWSMEWPGASAVTAADGVAFVTHHDGSLLALDLANPRAPVELDRIEGLGNPWAVAVYDDQLLVGDNSLGLVVVDASDLTDLAIRSITPALGGIQDVDAGDGVAYAAVGAAGVEVFDLADLDAPTSAGAWRLGSSAISVDASGDFLWATDQESVSVASIADPLSPAPRSSEKTPQWAMGVTADEDFAVVADWAVLATYALDADALAPKASLDRSLVPLSTDEPEATFTLRNLGADTLELSAAIPEDPAVTLTPDAGSLAPGASLTLTAVFDADRPVIGGVCLVTNDPDQPLLTVELSDERMTSVAVGEVAEDFSLSDIDGVEHRLSDELGRPVLLVFFATW